MKKYLFGLFAIAVAVVFSAYTVKTSTTDLYFHGSTYSEIYDINEWKNFEPTPSCGGQEELPCKVEFTQLGEETFEDLLNTYEPQSISALESITEATIDVVEVKSVQ